jgi:hypothetical protein
VGGQSDERKIDRESATGVMLEKLDVQGSAESEVDEIIAKVVKDRKSVDQEFLRVRPFYLDSNFGLLGGSANIGTKVCATLKDLAAAPPLSKKSRRSERGSSRSRRVVGVYRSSIILSRKWA